MIEIKKLASFALLLSMLLFALPVNSAAANVSDFSDVSSSSWFYNAVSFVTSNGMFNGTSTSTFSPNGTMTRGMFVTVLGRYGGAPTVSEGCMLGTVTKSDVNLRSAPTTSSAILARLQSGSKLEVLSTVDDPEDPEYKWYNIRYNGILGYIRNDLMTIQDSNFSDVSLSSYYYSYVQWAFSSGIASATGVNTFSPDRDITREEICSMLTNYASYKNYSPTVSVAPVSFSDSYSITSGYTNAVSLMQQSGVINGYPDGSFKPKGNATRAEVSVMLMRFLDAISYKPVSEVTYDSSGNYIFGASVPQTSGVGSDYFSDACFIGHSLVNGMSQSFGLTNIDYYAKNGATARYFLGLSDFTLSTTHVDETGSTVNDTGTLEQVLNEKSYGKVYIMLGVNEIGTTDSSRQTYYSSMSNIISLVKRTQPNAIIYLFSFSPVSQDCSEGNKAISRDNIISYNSVIKQLCIDNRAYYLNVFDLLCNNNGFLDESGCMSDGIHLLSSQYAIIKSYLLSHAIQ